MRLMAAAIAWVSGQAEVASRGPGGPAGPAIKYGVIARRLYVCHRWRHSSLQLHPNKPFMHAPPLLLLRVCLDAGDPPLLSGCSRWPMSDTSIAYLPSVNPAAPPL
jgi:hypothetical protein